jgi:tRNA (cmo5U34)-methyltransferase
MSKKQISTKPFSWNFSKKTVKNFDQHIKLSVPHYLEGHDLILKLAEFFIKDDSICYELGTSTGSISSKLAKKFSEINSMFIGFDNEIDMINIAKKIKLKNLRYVLKDIKDCKFKSSDMIISYYTIQFIHSKYRQDIFNKIYNSLNWGGAFILFEKVRAPDARFQDITSQMYDDFKTNNGFMEKEILLKTRSLRGVLDPYTSDENVQYLKRAGFNDILSIQKFLCFEGFLAVK